MSAVCVQLVSKSFEGEFLRTARSNNPSFTIAAYRHNTHNPW